MPQAKPAHIQRNDRPYERDTHKDACEELKEFWQESNGKMPFAEMAERGNWSRTMYSNMWRKYFEPAERGSDSSNDLSSDSTSLGAGDILEGDISIPDNPVEAFVRGFQEGQKADNGQAAQH